MIAGLIARVVDKHSLYDHLKNQYLHELIKEDSSDGDKTSAVVINKNNNK
jgi:hypothetical protein